MRNVSFKIHEQPGGKLFCNNMLRNKFDKTKQIFTYFLKKPLAIAEKFLSFILYAT